MSVQQLGLLTPVRPCAEAGPDVAYTPDWLAQAIVRRVLRSDLRRGDVVLEAHVGGGAFLRALDGHAVACEPMLPGRAAQVYAMDLDPHAAGLQDPPPWACVAPGDFRDGLPAGWPAPHWILGNPPWSDAVAHMEAALELAQAGIAWVLPAGLEHRVGWYDAGIWERAWPDEIVALGRISYDGPGRAHPRSSQTDSALYIWRRRRGVQTLPWRGAGYVRQMPGWLRGRP